MVSVCVSQINGMLWIYAPYEVHGKAYWMMFYVTPCRHTGRQYLTNAVMVSIFWCLGDICSPCRWNLLHFHSSRSRRDSAGNGCYVIGGGSAVLGAGSPQRHQTNRSIVRAAAE